MASPDLLQSDHQTRQLLPSGFSASIIFITSSVVSGSKNNRSDVSKSVLTVSGLLFITTDSYPASFKAHVHNNNQTQFPANSYWPGA